MEHVLAHVTKRDIQHEPFPHIVIENAVSSEVCAKLIEAFPSPEVVTKGKIADSNRRFSFATRDVRESMQVGVLWKEFIELHVSQVFLNVLLSLFSEHIKTTYPDFEQKFGSLSSLRAGVRNIDTFDTVDVLLDAQLCVNTPVRKKPSSVKIAHLDDARKLFASLFYLRHPDDNSRGGELELYRYRSNKKLFHGSRLINSKYVEAVRRVPYKANTLVLFLNSLDGLHGVTPRIPTSYPRQFMNLVGEVREPLFDLAQFTEGKAGRAMRRLGLR